MYSVGLKLWSTNTGRLADEARRLFGEGVFSYIELFAAPGSLATLPEWERMHREDGVPFVIHNAHAATGFNLADPALAAKNRELHGEARHFAEALEASRIVFHGGVDGTVDETIRQLKALDEPRALLENKPFVPLPNPIGARLCRGATTEEIGRILAGADCGFCLDVGHAVCSAASQGLEPYGFVAELARRFRPAMFHLSDVLDLSSPFDAHPHLGTGVLDLARLRREVFPAGASISIETARTPGEGLEGFCRDVRCLADMV